MRLAQILKLLLLTGLLSGCWNLGIKGEAPGSRGNIDLLQSFIGQESESVIREFGLPDELLSDGDKQFMVYSAKSTDTNLIMVLWIPIPVWAINDWENTIHCLRFELDSDYLVKEYRLKSKVMRKGVYPIELPSYLNCQEVFWSWRERTKLQMVTDFPSTWNPYPSAWKEIIRQEGLEGLAKEEAERLAIEEAIKRKNILSLRDSLGKYMATSELEQLSIEGNPYAQFKLYTALMESKPTVAYRWLCKSADNGHSQARYTLGQIFEYSKQGHVQAYVWYSLSSYSQSGKFNEESLQSFVDKNLSAEEYQKARIALLEWRPGQCEKSLGLDSDIQQIQ